MNARSLFTTALLGLSLSVLAACGGSNTKLADANPKKFDPQVMEAELRAIYENRVVGFSYAINHKGQLARSGAWGLARRDVDGTLAMTAETRHNLASVSKTVNAIYFLRLKGWINGLMGTEYVSLDRSVSQWLPRDWVQGYGFFGDDGVTFRQLLAHRSGLGQMFDAMTPQDREYWDNDWDGLQFVVANGANPGDDFSYKNANHALFRFLVPELLHRSGLNPFIPPLTPPFEIDPSPDEYGQKYLANMNQRIMKPLDIDDVGCSYQESENHARFYEFRYPLLPGKRHHLDAGVCGGHAGLMMSAVEVAKLLAYARYTDVLLTDADRDAMIEDRLGWAQSDKEALWDDATARLLQSGVWLSRYTGDDLYLPDGTVAVNPRAEQHNCVMQFPRNVEAVLLINSSLKPGTSSPCSALEQAFEAALVDA